MTPANLTALSDAKVGTTGVVEHIDLPEEVSHYLAHLGFLPGTQLEVLRQAPAGDPRVYRIDGVEVGLRRETASHIFLKVEPQEHAKSARRAGKPTAGSVKPTAGSANPTAGSAYPKTGSAA